ncbi:DUF1285 domain-containing protein [Kangiella sp. HZ709]|uniref:DUF1285 domain-containing protein n=1 Tax=Kangiella sp. HZ709 TaxID=2666328 RepID=UPI0012B04301|nr:DUF1285 domain-containing protein [Kangiella sp. HZ709]MRX27889.1 DUF1285 domain-containing protein [Kangiella sp. HZ709]
MNNKSDLSALFSQLNQADSNSRKGLPPVDQWDPEFCGDMDLVIKRDGNWYYQGTPIGRKRLVKLFSTVLKKEGDNYYLVTPVEKLGIQVEDKPFFVIRMSQHNTDQGNIIELEDNCENKILLTDPAQFWVEVDSATEEPSPYVCVRKNLSALIHRNIFYELVDLSEENLINGAKHFGFYSANQFFSLGKI